MLTAATERGRAAALARFGIKEGGFFQRVLPELGAEASDVVTRQTGRAAFQPGGSLAPLKESLLGSPMKALHPSSWTSPKGMMNVKNLAWPSVPGHPIVSLLGKLNTGFAAYDAVQSLRGKSGDPNEGRLTNALSSIGQAAGNAIGFPAVGALGAPFIGSIGARLGRGLGRTLGSHADAQPTPQFEGYQ